MQIRLVYFVSFVSAILALDGDPYKTLGIKRSASAQDIRKIYKQLAKEWHPDKSADPTAEAKFVQIKQAYELLSDPDRRLLYDQKGITEEKDRPEHAPFQSHPFEDLFVQHGHFNFQENDITFFHKLSITTRQYDKIVVPKSARTPTLIFVYTDWCFPCLQSAPYIRKLVDYLEPLGVSLITVHSGRETSLARRLNIHSLPMLSLLLDGQNFAYKQTITSMQKVVDFIRKKLPYNLVPTLSTDDVPEFLNGWEDNRVRGLIFEPRQVIRLRYIITAYHFRDRVAFGFVDSDEIRNRYNVPDAADANMDSVLLFQENSSHPVASITMRDIPTTTLHHVIAANQYLALPRLSSQSVLESLCPCEWNKPRKRLCVVLVTRASEDHDAHRTAFRTLAQQAGSVYGGPERVRFAYIYHDRQEEFVNSLIPPDGEHVEPLLRIVVIWRRDTSHVKYEWLDDKWECEQTFNDTSHKLETTIRRLLHTSEALTYEALVNDLFDEHAKGVIGRILTRASTIALSLYNGLDQEQIKPALSLLGTIVFIIILGYVMAYLVRIEEEKVQRERKNQQNSMNGEEGDNNNSSGGFGSDLRMVEQELKLHELRGEKYHGLIRLLKPGCRTILLVLDMQSRHALIPPFHRAVWPYRKNKTLMFSYMLIERGLNWYKDILELSLPEGRELNINPRNCVGTVLALNGHRKYFCMFHAKHTEKNKQKKNNHKSLNQRPSSADVDPEVGQFIGFDTDSSESDLDGDGSGDDVLLQSHLLDGLPNWLDRLFEGTTHRFHINYWPDFPNK